MTEAKRDNNGVPVMIAASNADGSTMVLIKANPNSHRIYLDDGTTGSDLSGDDAKRDQNSVTGALGTSSSDGTTPVPIYANPNTGGLLTKST